MKKQMLRIICVCCAVILTLAACSDKQSEEPFEQSKSNEVNNENQSEEKIGFITSFNESVGKFDFDELEWLTNFDTERIEELEKLGLEIKDHMPGGFYIYNPNLDTQNYVISDATEYCIIDWNTMQHKTVSLEELLHSYNSYAEWTHPYSVVIDNGVVVSVKECYVP